MNTIFFRLFSKKIQILPSGCWAWTGQKNIAGYGRARYRGRKWLAHRLAWILTFGEIAVDNQICHKCDNRWCVNPDHLFEGTRSDNMRDMVQKGRHGAQKDPSYFHRGDNHWTHIKPERLARGDKNGLRVHPESVLRGEKGTKAKLTRFQVLEIRSLYKAGEITQRQLASKYNVSQGTIGFILRRETWRED